MIHESIVYFIGVTVITGLSTLLLLLIIWALYGGLKYSLDSKHLNKGKHNGKKEK